MRRRRHEPAAQMELALESRSKWGGKRAGSGRKKSERRIGVPHDARQPHARRFPVHVTLRTVREVGHLRAKKPFAVIREAMQAARKNPREGFRVVHFSVQGNHMHLIVEAKDAKTLGRGMQGLSIRIARGVNRLLRRSGKVFSDRYHRHDLKSPRETRNALAYVLLNHRKHAFERGERCERGWTDPCSSAEFFDGWSHRRRFISPDDDDAPVAAPKTWMLTKGWQLHSRLISPDEIP